MEAEERRHPEADGPSSLVSLSGLLGASELQRSQAEFPGAELLRGASPLEVLRRITERDALGLRERCEQRRAQRAILTHAARLLACTRARAARAAINYRGESALDAWLGMQIDLALQDICADDREGAISAIEPADPQYFEELARSWAVAPRIARDACVAFNGLPHAVRRAYWALAVDGKSVAQCVDERLGSASAIEARVERALITIGTLRDPGGDDQREGASDER